MPFSLEKWINYYPPGLLEEIADLWNRNAAGRHSFQVWDGKLLARLLIDGGAGIGAMRAARTPTGELAGLIHVNMPRGPDCALCGVVEMLLVDRGLRRQGLGGRLLRDGLNFLASQNPAPTLVDALGAWPFGNAYNSLADGSERSGVFLSEPETFRLFKKAGFAVARRSLVMRAHLTFRRPRQLPSDIVIRCSPRRENSWLDHVFRGRDLWNHNLELENGEPLSRAIFALMEGESRAEGQAIFSLFGVNTPPDRQRRGYAGLNLAMLMDHLAALGGELLEIHVYADNQPALALYRSLGFRQLAETAMLHYFPARRRP
jgi:ribosomal protein S18 acetylase RimI-like enzyme